MTFFTFLRFTEQQNMLQQQLKEATVGTKTLKAQPYFNGTQANLYCVQLTKQ